MSRIRSFMGVRSEAVGELAEVSNAPESYLAFGGRRPRLPTEPARVETENSLIVPRPHDPGEVFHVKPHPKPAEPPAEN